MADTEAQLNYLCRDKYYHAMQTLCKDSTPKTYQTFQFYRAFALLFGSSIPEAMRALEMLESDDTVCLGVYLALIYAHKKSNVVDRDAVKELEQNLKDRRKRASPMALYYAALFLYHCEKLDKAREYVDRALKNDDAFVAALSLKGWIELGSIGNGSYVEDALHWFQSALDYDKNYLDAFFGLVCVDKLRGKYDTAIAVLNRLIVKHPQLVAPLIEKMKVQLAQKDWDQVLELSNRILNLDKNNMEAMKMQALCMVCRDGKYDECSGLLDMIYSEIEINESRNVPLFIMIAQLFSRICGRNEKILLQTLKFAQKAVELQPSGVISMTELGYQLMLLNRIPDAISTFQNATKLDESSVEALTYLTYCQIIKNESEVAEQQIDLLYEIQGKKTPLLSLMSAILNRDNPEQALVYLNEATNLHLEQCHRLPYSDLYLKSLNPDFLILLVTEFMRYFPPQQGINDATKKSIMILKKLTENIPASLNGIYLFAKVQFHGGDLGSATQALQRIIKEIDPGMINAHLLLGRIFLEQGLYQRAAQVLEVGVSYNFRVRENPLYFLINGLIFKSLGKFEESIESFKKSLSIIDEDISLMDKATLYLELADVLLNSNRKQEALEIMEEASNIFRNTSEESRILIANAEFSVKNQELEYALELLDQIKSGDPYYLQAHTKLANLYLHTKRDRAAFTRCFREVVENCPGPETFVLLGDAYMSVLELDLAIESYQQALKQNALDPDLAKKMGSALVTTFRYDEAITYYKEAIKNPNNLELKFDLADLYLKLDQYEAADSLLAEDLSGDVGEDSLSVRVKQLLLLGKVRELSGKLSSALSVVKEARDIQHKLQRRAIMDQTGSVLEQKEILSDICVRMGEICKLMRDNEQAIQHYKEALNATPNNVGISVDLAKLYLQLNLREQCEQICSSILQNDPENEDASIIMADLAFRKIDFETALHHFKQLLIKQPQNWKALARLIEIARRTGNLEEVPEHLQRAEQDANVASKEAGFAYCSGLYDWFSGNLNGALRNFNKARMDTDYGQQAILNMIDICLNPDDDFLGVGDIFSDSVELDSRQMAIEMAERLYRELRPRQNDELTHKLLKNFILLATKQKPNVELALQEFINIAESYKDHVGPILGMCTAYLLLKQNQRARNQLKRVVKNVWSYEESEYLERCWLLLADYYVQSSKYEIAGDLLKRVLQHNKSCVKAYEYGGYIGEKEQSYKEAAYNYDKAWKLSGRTKPATGYKLAYTYLKSKQYADALEIASQVLKEYPEYPKIRKDIYEKARNHLRT